MKTLTPDSMKFKKLQRRLRVSKCLTVGTLELLWLATAKSAPDGGIGRFTNEEIAIECDWDGDPDELVTALLECGWLDQHADCRLVVHDWADHAPNHVVNNLKRWGKSFVCPKETSKVDPSETPKDDPKEIPTKPDQTKPNLTRTQPHLTTPVQSVGSSSCSLNFSWTREDVDREIERFRKESKVGPSKVPLPMLAKLVGFGLCTDNGFTSEIAVSFREEQVRVPSRYIDGAIAQYCKKRGLVADDVVASVLQRLDVVKAGNTSSGDATL